MNVQETIEYLNEITEKECELLPESAIDRITYAITQIEILSAEGAIKDRALVVARGVLEELCEFIWENFEDPVRKEHILRARDQVMNAKLGKLSSDPFPVATRQEI